ncbi:MAG: hypothetical protein LYZ70_01095 [Nitrososphaerales archaeon]|nr:hypothetical protein [Nitrososphaerales archaeon]
MSTEIAEELSKQTRDLINRFESRANSFAHRADLAKLTVQVDVPSAEKLAKKLFGEGEHVATGIDGSMDFDERLQMMLFYSNATAYNCPFRVGDHLSFDLTSAHRDSKLAAAAAVPLWAEDVASVFSNQPEIDLELEHSMERIPNSFMTLGELYLAVLATAKAKIIFLDRPLSGTFSTLSRDARNLIKRGESKLVKVPGAGRVSLLDIELAINLGSPTMIVPTRRRFLTLAVLKLLMGGPLSLGEIASKLHVTEGEAARALARIHKVSRDHADELIVDKTDTKVKLDEKIRGYWDRVSALSLSYAQYVFDQKGHPLSLGNEEYLTILDVNSVALFLLDELYHRAKLTGVLLTGVAKDTTATDISRSVLPFARRSGFVKMSSPAPLLKNDKAFLAILSSENPSVATPWRTIGYDSAYSTIVEIGPDLVSARRVVSREKLFVRSFFQLRTLRSDPSVRSQVFLFDRPFDDMSDGRAVRRFTVVERVGKTEVDAYFEGGDGSPLSNLILHILSLNDNPEVFEAFGHNQLLYLADKAVKAEVRMMRSSLRGVADLRVGGVSRRRKIFGLVTTYREQRAESEHARMRAASR